VNKDSYRQFQVNILGLIIFGRCSRISSSEVYLVALVGLSKFTIHEIIPDLVLFSVFLKERVLDFDDFVGNTDELTKVSSSDLSLCGTRNFS
jgi:hypothetical protein